MPFIECPKIKYHVDKWKNYNQQAKMSDERERELEYRIAWNDLRSITHIHTHLLTHTHKQFAVAGNLLERLNTFKRRRKKQTNNGDGASRCMK